jgi:regulator of sigma E protease
MQFLLDLLPAAVVLGVLIFIHELGHFIACRLTGVKVEKFSIGFGPEIFSFQAPETRYAISLIPLGGFVKPSGESHEELASREPASYDFIAQGPVTRFGIAVAGIAMNFFLAYVLFSAVFMAGRPVTAASVGGFVEGYPAAASGLAVGDRIVAVNGHPVENWRELTSEIFKAGAETLALSVAREGELATVSLAPRLEETRDVFGKWHQVSRIGILPGDDSVVEKYPPLEALAKGAELLVETSGLTCKAIAYLVTGQLSLKNVSGPIGIFVIASKTAHMGFVHLVQLTAFLSVSLAVFNLLPFPPLDGGLMLFIAIEALRKKRVSLRVQDAVTKTGFVLLLTLMVVVMYNDLVNIDFFSKLQQLFKK